MTFESLEAAIKRAGSPVELLRQSTARPHAFPVAPEFTNWRTEQSAWRTTCVLFDQSHHMTDLFLRGPGALPLLSSLGVNSFANFGPGRAKQYVAVNADGHLIGDAILFHLEEDLFDVVGHPTVANWLQYNVAAGGLGRDGRARRQLGRPPVGPAGALPLRTAGADRRRDRLQAHRRPAARREVLPHDRLRHRRAPGARAAARHGRPAGLRAVRPVGRGRGRARRDPRRRRGVRPAPGRGQGLLHLEPGVWLDPDGGAGDLRSRHAGLPGMARRRRARLARREHGLRRHRRLLRHAVRHRLRPDRQVRP